MISAKCFDPDFAVLSLADAFGLAQTTADHNERLEILFKTISTLKDQATPEEYSIITDLVDEFLNEDKGTFKAALSGYKSLIFTPGFNFELWKANKKKAPTNNAEETINRRTRVHREFLLDKFRGDDKVGAPQAMLYFNRSMRLKLLETFLANREGGYLVAENEVACNAKKLKQQLLDKVIEYIKTVAPDADLSDTLLYKDPSAISGILSDGSLLRGIITPHLTLGQNITVKELKDNYKAYKKRSPGWENSKLFLDAYNAWLMLNDFDKITTMLVGSIVKPGLDYYNLLGNSLYETTINKATNMWGNGFGDEVANIADLVSEVTQELISTCKKHKWGDNNDTSLKDSNIINDENFLSFSEFNAIIGKVKNLAINSISKDIKLDPEDDNVSNDTKRVIRELQRLRKQQGLDDDIPTFQDLVCFISDNPQRHLHAIFDILCNTDAIDSLSSAFSAEDKNLIWTLNKELFGICGENSRSLYDLHKNSNGDRIYEIISQIADSMFADSFMQYYEDIDGTIKVRLLQDYTMALIKKELMADMRQTNGTFDPAKFLNFKNKWNIELINTPETYIYSKKENGIYKGRWNVANPDYDASDPSSKKTIPQKSSFLDSLKIEIPNLFLLRYNKSGQLDVKITSPGKAKEVWESNIFRDFIKDSLGIDFEMDPDFADSFAETFKDSEGNIGYKGLVNNLLTLSAKVIFNLSVNNIYVPTILGDRVRNSKNIDKILQLQYSGGSIPKINMETGAIEMLTTKEQDQLLSNLSKARAISYNLINSAQVKTGEGTALATTCLSCLRSSYPYQIMTQNRRKASATSDLEFVKNDCGLFKGIIKRREFKSGVTTKVNTSMSAVESFATSFLCGWVSAFTPKQRSSALNGGGDSFILSAVYSDKTILDEINIQLNAISKHLGKRFTDMSDRELTQEIKNELGPMYQKIITNINFENAKVAMILGIDVDSDSLTDVSSYESLLLDISDTLCPEDVIVNKLKKDKKLAEIIANLNTIGITDNVRIVRMLESDSNTLKATGDHFILLVNEAVDPGDTLKYSEAADTYYKAASIIDKNYSDKIAKIRKNTIKEGLHAYITEFNKTHRIKPIELCEHVHYVFNADGNLSPNKTLLAEWARFTASEEEARALGIDLYYKANELSAMTVEGYFRLKDLQVALELTEDGFELYLLGNQARQLEEIKYLIKEYPEWITKSGKMAIARIFKSNTTYNVGDVIQYANGNEGLISDINTTDPANPIYEITANGKKYYYAEEAITGQISRAKGYRPATIDPSMVEGSYVPVERLSELKQALSSNPDLILVHPMLTRLNRMAYLALQEYTSSIGGAHYVYKGGGKDVLTEEANRWLASNKRNVCYASTVHKYQNKTLTGVPKWYQLSIIEDIDAPIYSIMGDLTSHSPIDGGMFVNPWFPILENNSLGGEAAGLDKKQFGTFYYDRYAAGGIIKTAGFASTNARMRRSIPYRNLTQNMTDRVWIKEFADINGTDIPEVLDITKDYKGNDLDWVLDANGELTYYKRNTSDGKSGLFRLAYIESLGNNLYKIYEFPVTRNGKINTEYPGIAEQLASNSSEDVEPILRMDGADENGIITIDSNWKLFNYVFGGAYSCSLNPKTGLLQYSENSILQMVHALNNIGYTRTVENNDANFGEDRYEEEEFDSIESLDELWQPLKYSDVSYSPNIGAIKSTQMNVNPKENLYELHFLNSMKIMMGQLGIQLDKEHHADESEVSMPTQIILACANKGYTIHYSSKLYNSLSTLTEIAIQDCMDGIMQYMEDPSQKGPLLKEVSKIIVDKLIHGQSDSQALEAAMAHLVTKAKANQKFEDSDVVAKIAWSDPGIYNKIYNDLASHFTNKAIKMKFAGTLAVICPTEKMEQMYGDRRLDAYASLDSELSEEIAMQIHQEEISLGKYPKLLIFDVNLNTWLTDLDKLNYAANLDTLHHYWIEYADGTKESVLIDTPIKYYEIKDWLVNGKNGNEVFKIYEDITKGRELGAFNARFEAVELTENLRPKKYSILDLDTIHQMFAFNDMKLDIDTVDLLLNGRILAKKKEYAEELIGRLLNKLSPKAYKYLVEWAKANPDQSLTEIARACALATEGEYPELMNDFVAAAFKVAKVLTYKEMESDLFKISKDFNGDRKLWVNGEEITVDPDSILTQAYELIMPKVYQTRFGLEEFDLVQEILADPDFFTKRAINKVKLRHVPEECFDFELKRFDGEHVYIYDARKGIPNPEIFKPSRKFKSITEDGRVVRIGPDFEIIHPMASMEDTVMQIGDLGYEVIITENPEFYLEQLPYNLATFSTARVQEEHLQEIVDKLKDSPRKSTKKFINTITEKNGTLKPYRKLVQRDNYIKELSIDLDDDADIELLNLTRQFILEGKELHASFNKSLDIIAGRIPAQSQQSFMPQRVVAFDNNNINSAYVSTFQLFLQGSDLDIDAVTLLGSEFDKNGKYITWSPFSDISSIEKLEASQLLPFPTGHPVKTGIYKGLDSFFIMYNDYFKDLLSLEIDPATGSPIVNNDGFPIIKLKELSADNIKLLGLFLEDVNFNGLSLKGKKDSEGNWVIDLDALAEISGEKVIEIDKGDGTKITQTITKPIYLRDLGFNTANGMLNALSQIQDLVNSHNLYINEVDTETRQMMAKNQCQWAMYQICSTPSNLVELMVGVDESTKPIKDKKNGAVAASQFGGRDAKTAPGAYTTTHNSFQEGLTGKLCVGIGAVSIKVNSTTQFYMDYVLSHGSEAQKERLLLPFTYHFKDKAKRRGYEIAGKHYEGLSNLYDKSSETAEEVTLEIDGKTVTMRTSQKNAEIIKLLDSIKAEEDITPNVAMSLAAMLSVAVDNAKDLALAKINAGPKMFGFYAYGISLGIDIRELAKIINTPQGRSISKLCEGNIFNDEMGAFSALQAIKKLEGQGIYTDLHRFDINGAAHEVDEENVRPEKRVISLEDYSVSKASELVEIIMSEYYKDKIVGNKAIMSSLRYKPNTTDKNNKPITKATLENMVYLISLVGKMDECILYIVNSTSWNKAISLINDPEGFGNSKTWIASTYQLMDYCSKYGNIVATYYAPDSNFEGALAYHLSRDLKILAEGAEEMRILGSILSSNKGVKSRTEEGTTFIKTIENAVIDRKEIMGEPISEEDYIDFVLFCTDSSYREQAIMKYEAVKHTTNILDVVSTAPHFLSYLRTCAIPYQTFKMGSSKFRARDKYYDIMVDTLKLSSSNAKENAIRGIENAVQYTMFTEWAAQLQLMFHLPKYADTRTDLSDEQRSKNKFFVGRSKDMKVVESNDGINIPLWTAEGLATFKYYMENVIIPSLLNNPGYIENEFVKGLQTFEFSKTGTHATVNAFTLSGNMLPHTEMLDMQLQTYIADFSTMYAKEFPNGSTSSIHTIPSIADAFYIYSMYVFNGRKSPRSLMALFADDTSDFAKSFQQYVALADDLKDYEFSMEELIPWCAPKDNVYSPSAKVFYAQNSDGFGQVLYLKIVQKQKSEDGQDEAVEDAGVNRRKKKNFEKYPVIEPTDTARQYFLYPVDSLEQSLVFDEKRAESIEVINIADSNGMSITLSKDSLTGKLGFTLQDSEGNVVTDKKASRELAILKLLNSNIDAIVTSRFDFNTHRFVESYDSLTLQSAVDEALKEVDHQCG